MEGLEGRLVRPRQVRYQAALRPDIRWSLHLNPPHHNNDKKQPNPLLP
jgi:hypothetical protein